MNRRKFFGGLAALVAAPFAPKAAERLSFRGVPIIWDTEFDPLKSTYIWWRKSEKRATFTAEFVEEVGGIHKAKLCAALREAWEDCKPPHTIYTSDSLK